MKDLTQGAPFKIIHRFAVPLLIGNMITQLYQLVDAVIVGQFVGKEALAAVGASVPIVFVLISLIIGIGTGCTILISQYFGARDIENVKKTIDTMTLFVVISALVITGICLAWSSSILRVIHIPTDVFTAARQYFTIYVIGILPLFGVNSTLSILRGVGDSTTPLYYLIFSTLLNVALDLLFIPVLGWGIQGAAWATVFSETLVAFILIVRLNKYHEMIRIDFFHPRFDLPIFKQSIRIGIPNGFQQTFTALGSAAMIGVVSIFGTEVLAAFTGVCRIEMLTTTLLSAYGVAVSSFVGQNLGAHQILRVHSGIRAGVLLSVVLAFVMGLLIWLCREQVMLCFTDSSETVVIGMGKRYLGIVCPFYVVFAVMYVLNGALRGAGDTLIPMFISLVSLWMIRIPLAWVLSRIWGPDGIWWSVPISWGVGALLLVWYYFAGRWQHKTSITRQEVALTLEDPLW